MADPQRDLVAVRNAELARRGLGAAQGISDFAAPVRDTLYSGIANPLAYLQDMASAAGSGLYGAASDISGFGASVLGAPELGEQLFSQADESYGNVMTRLKDALPKAPQSQEDLDIFSDENLGIPAFDTQIPATKRSIIPATEREAGKVFSGGVTESGSGSLGPKVIPSDVQGGRGSDPRPQIAKDAAAAAVSPAQELFDSAFQEYISGVRGSGPDAPSPKELEDYKAEFAKATGLDVSGKADTSQALMAFGLAAMQNRAGKGFNVGRMLESLGQAGEKALPALDKARTEARANSAAAGKYALEMRSSDKEKATAAKEKAMQRTGYYVVPKSTDVKGFLAGVSEGKGRLENLNVWELEKLQNNKEFADKYDVLPGSMWGEIVKEAMKTPEAKELYLTTPQPVQLIPGNTEDIFKIDLFFNEPNKNPNGKPMVVGDGQQQYEALARMYQDNQKAKDEFVKLGVLNEGTNIFRYSLDALNGLAAGFGVTFTDDLPESQKMKLILEKMAAKQAPRILGESGKTISDGDRERVERIVGTITATSDQRELEAKFSALFNDIIIGSEADINQALSTLNRHTGRNIGSALQKSELSEDKRSSMMADLKALGVI